MMNQLTCIEISIPAILPIRNEPGMAHFLSRPGKGQKMVKQNIPFHRSDLLHQESRFPFSLENEQTHWRSVSLDRHVSITNRGGETERSVSPPRSVYLAYSTRAIRPPISSPV